LIIIDLLRKCSDAERAEVLDVLHAHRDDTTPEQIERVIGLAHDRGAIAFAEEESRIQGEDAVRLLEALPATPERQLLREMLEFFVQRAF
jgi:geranylgeranyl pyrophosphate synthase